MNIKKLKHCCMLIDVGKIRIITDPGIYSLEEHDKVNHADIVLITHEHPDHYHLESLKALVKRCPDISVITNDAVGELIAQEGVKHHVMKHGDKLKVKDVEIEAYGEKHAMMHKSIPQASNVGFFIADKLFYPGDALTDPKRPVDVLALPIAGPWVKISEAIDYAMALNPRLAFPVHDAIRFGIQHILAEKVLVQNGIEFIKLEEGGQIKL